MRLKIVILITFSVLLIGATPAVALAGTYTVRPGDTLYSIGQANNISYQTIMRDNKLTSTVLHPGQKLWLPDSVGFTYYVKAGDSLYSLATRFGTSIQAIRQANRLYTNTLQVGQALWIPRRQAGTQVSAASRSGTPTWNAGDLNLLARLVYAEAEGEVYVGQVAVAAVVLNRLKNPAFPKTLAGVIYQPGAFETVSNGRINLAPDATAIRAAREALAGWDPTGGAIYFFNPAYTTSKWIWSRPILVTYGNHCFAA